MSADLRAGRICEPLLVVAVYGWLALSLIALAKAALGLNEFPWIGIVLATVSLGAGAAGYLAARSRSPAMPVRRKDGWLEPTPTAACLLLALFVGGEWLISRYVSPTDGMALSEVRRLRAETVQVDVPPWVLYINYLSNMCGYLATFIIFARVKTRRYYFAWAISISVFAYLTARISGGRFPAIAIMLFAAVIWYSSSYRANRMRRMTMYAAGLASVLVFIGANIAFSTLRFEGSTQGAEVFLTETAGARMLAAVGIDHPSAPVAYVTGLMDEYIGRSVLYLDEYIRHEDLEAAFGKYNYRFMWRRFYDYDWFELKNEVDEVLLVVGVTHNVWATGIRDIWVDFGIFTPVPVMALVGFAVGSAQRSGVVSDGAKLMAFLVTTWFLGSPLFSIARITGFELTTYIAALWWFADHVRAQVGKPK